MKDDPRTVKGFEERVISMTYWWWEVRRYPNCRHALHSETNVLPLGEPRDFLWSPNLPPLDLVSVLSLHFCFSSDETVEGRASPKFQARSWNNSFQPWTAPPTLPHVAPSLTSCRPPGAPWWRRTAQRPPQTPGRCWGPRKGGTLQENRCLTSLPGITNLPFFLL